MKQEEKEQQLREAAKQDALKLEAREKANPKVSAEFNWYEGAKSEAAKAYHQQTDVEFELLNSDLPENMPLYKDSGLWQLRSDDMNEIKLQQFINERFIDFLLRCKQFNIEEILKP